MPITKIKHCIKSAAFAANFTVLTIVMGLIALPVPFVSRKAGWKIVRIWARLILIGQFYICRSKSVILGKKNIVSEPMLVAANHQSTWDMFALVIHLPDPVFIVKKELFTIPILGWWIKAIGCIGIDRRHPKTAIESVLYHAGQALENGSQVVIFPEGTRLAPETTKPYAKGIARLYERHDVPCLPFSHNSGYCWPRSGFGVRPGIITGTFCAPIAPGLSRKAFHALLETTIRSNIIVPSEDDTSVHDHSDPLAPA